MAEIIRTGSQFHLRNSAFSYVLTIMPGGVPAHLYAGDRIERLAEAPLLRHAGVGESFTLQGCSLDHLPQEYPSWGLGDMRTGALMVEAPDGTCSADLRFVSAGITDGKPALPGLPATFGEDCQTLSLTLADAHLGLEAVLRYTIFEDCSALTRSVLLRNTGEKPLRLLRADSLCLELPDDRWDLITLTGAWARERAIERRPLRTGDQGVSTRCGASSLQTSPFLALARPHATEDSGECFGTALIYSGSFRASASVGQYGGTRVLLGINSEQFAWRLEPGDSFQTPEAALVWSAEGLDGMSQAFHTLWKRHLLPPRWVGTPRPVLLNSWEAAYFDFDEDKLVDIARAAKEAGVSLFVVDDGWFGRRDDDTTSLGDWQADLRKLPHGLQGLGERIRALGLQLGIWMEPEMISPESELYRAHPDWSLHIDGREPITARSQLILDLSREDVQRFVTDSVSRVLRESGAAYLKWDMNRNFSNVGSALLPPQRQSELPHRYILGLYAVMEELTRRVPDVLIEGCASGGGRFDPGMLRYVPQFWCSDNTDALSRCRIQYGTSLLFPPSAMGSHVSAVPNHQTGRVTPMETRFAVALAGSFGYELDPRKLSGEDRAAMLSQTAMADATQALRLGGAFHRLLSPFEGNDTAWIFVSQDRREALFTLVRERAEANRTPPLVRLCGLDPALRYRIEETGEVYGGDELMKSGLLCPLPRGDAASILWHLKEAEA